LGGEGAALTRPTDTLNHPTADETTRRRPGGGGRRRLSSVVVDRSMLGRRLLDHLTDTIG